MPVQEIKLKAASDAPSKSGLENVPPDQLERAMKAAMARSDGDLDLTEEEQNKFTKAFQDKEFRKMMAEYVDEISDPKHRAEQDAYIREMEAKGGTISASRGAAVPSRHRRDSWPSHNEVGGLFSILRQFGPSRCGTFHGVGRPKFDFHTALHRCRR